jgi:hypothetical protein
MPVRVFRTISISRAIVVGFCPPGQLMPNGWAFNFPSLRDSLLRSRVPDAVRRAKSAFTRVFAALWPLRRAGTHKIAGELLATWAPALQRTAEEALRCVRGTRPPHPRPAIARRATASPIKTNADVTSGPPTKIRVGVFILFHS